MAKTPVPAVEGLFTMDPDAPHLIGGKVPGRESYFFPRDLAGSDPAVSGPCELETVELSRRGEVWSYTTSHYQPPPPFVAATEPYEPITIAAVRLPKEQLVVLGQCVSGVTPDDLGIGAEVELVLDVLYSDDDHDYMVWKWKPLPAAPDADDPAAGTDRTDRCETDRALTVGKMPPSTGTDGTATVSAGPAHLGPASESSLTKDVAGNRPRWGRPWASPLGQQAAKIPTKKIQTTKIQTTKIQPTQSESPRKAMSQTTARHACG